MTGDSGALRDAAAWFDSALAGSMILAICSISIAVLGLAMLAGRFDIRRGATVILGCFVVLGASTIAAGLVGRPALSATASDLSASPAAPPEMPRKASRQTDDPYAGASLAQ